MSAPSRQRWVVLAAFCGVNLTIQLLWISYAPVTVEAQRFYGVSELAIGLLAMSFMIAFLPLSIPASWVLDTRGFKRGVGVGAALMAVFGPLRGLAGSSFWLVALCTVMLAAAQPFFLNAWTSCAARFFPRSERATAVGIITLANLVGTGVGMAVTPVLLQHLSLDRVQLVWGVAAAVSAVVFALVAKDRSDVPVGPPGEEVRSLTFDGLSSALKNRSFQLYLGIMFAGMGVFNGVTTWIEPIATPKGLDAEDAGALGAVMLVAGLIGAVVIPALSDRQRRRRRYIVMGVLLAAPGVLGLGLGNSFAALAASSAWLGFWLTSTLPVGLQYVAELTHPTPEATSSGVIQLAGQASVVFVYIMEAMKSPTSGFFPALALSAALLTVSALLAMQLVEVDVPTRAVIDLEQALPPS